MKSSRVIVPSSNTPPENHELDIASLISTHFNCVVEFLIPSTSYKQKTPDFVMNGLMWEIKSPKGVSKKTIEKQIRIALKQSRNIIIDTRRTKLTDVTITKELLKLLNNYRKINKLLLINKRNDVVIIFNKNK